MNGPIRINGACRIRIKPDGGYAVLGGHGEPKATPGRDTAVTFVLDLDQWQETFELPGAFELFRRRVGTEMLEREQPPGQLLIEISGAPTGDQPRTLTVRYRGHLVSQPLVAITGVSIDVSVGVGLNLAIEIMLECCPEPPCPEPCRRPRHRIDVFVAPRVR